MPNFVTTKIHFKTDVKELVRIKEFLTSEESEFDFNKVIPMPEDLAIDASSLGDEGMIFLDKNNPKWEEVAKKISGMQVKMQKKALDLGWKYLDNIKKYGYKCWYEWCVAKWGTKWNVSRDDIFWDDATATIQTAWSCPFPVLKEISRRFPSVIMEVVYADEDAGYNCGEFVLQAGETIESNIPQGGSDEAMEIYFSLNEWAREEMVKSESGQWVYA